MFPLFRSLERDSGSAATLPQVWQAFKANGIRFHPGEVSMWVGPPGAGKSTAALNYILKAKRPTLYVSMDMGPMLVSRRVIAIETDQTLDKVREDMETDEGPARYSGVLQAVDHLYVTYPTRPDADSIAKSVMAFQEIHGLPPEILVIDNLMNLSSNAKDEWTGLRELAQVFHYIAVELSITVLLLHHINMGGLDLSYPAPENAIKGQISELPATILSFAKREALLLCTAVKNRHGKADHTGRNFFQLAYDEPKQIITDYIPPPPEPPKPKWVIQPSHDWGIKD
jgi:predicted ATP-dependent serine protease